MDKRTRRRRRKNAIKETMDMVKTILLIVIAVVVVGFVVLFIKGSIGSGEKTESKMDIFSSIFKGKGEEETEGTSEAGEEPEEALTDGFHEDKNGKIYFVKDGLVVSDEWMDLDKSLYRIGEDGFVVTGEYEEDAYLYTFSEQGKLTDITQNASYRDTEIEYPGLVKKGGLMVYLDKSETFGRFYSIVYRKSSVSHKLGGTSNMQYTLPGSIQTDEEGYVYWLPVTDNADELEKLINRNLYRMQPGSETRQIVAEEVDGYRVTTGENGETVIYYSKKGGMYRCGSAACKEDEQVFEFTEDMEYRLEIASDGKLYLKTVSGYPVLKAFESFNTLGMTYTISEKGEILSREDSVFVQDGVLEYSIYSDEVFNGIRSVVVREDETGTGYYISGDFAGECHSLYLNPLDEKLYAEYVSTDGVPHVIMITTEGDVDQLLGTPEDTEFLEIYGFTAEGVIVKLKSLQGVTSFSLVSTGETSPLALGSDPIPVQESVTESVPAGPGAGPGYGPGSTTQNKPVSGFGPGEISGPGAGPGEVLEQPVMGN